jgi:streptomycin 6-kinase
MREAAARWGLREANLVADTPTSRVYRAIAANGAKYALKVLKPYGADETMGAALMGWYGGSGAAEVVAIEDGIILMEWLEGPTLGDIVRRERQGAEARDGEATTILCDVVRWLHQPRPRPPPSLTPLADHLRQLIEADLSFLPPAHRPLWERARRLCLDLLATSTTPLPLHGDLHHDNVIGSPRGWLAIDPKGLTGDPHYELANVFRNPCRAEVLVAEPARVEALADAFAQKLALDRARVLAWAAVHSAIAAIWDHAAGNAFGWDLTMTPLLFAALDRTEDKSEAPGQARRSAFR